MTAAADVWSGRRVLVGVGGGIAAYKVCELVSTLAQAGAEVQVILTEAAQRFVTPLTFSSLSRRRAWTDADFWTAEHGRPLHIDLGEWAELLILAPLTADALARLTWGLAEDLLGNTLLASTAPVLLAPAMNTDMWEQPQVQRNWQQLLGLPRYVGVGPGSGRLACDRVGSGRMAEPEELLWAAECLLLHGPTRDLGDRRILINAGGTREYLDPVRYIGNPSTGRMGLALAWAARQRGADVTLVHAPWQGIPAALTQGFTTVAVETSEQMRAAMLDRFPGADWTFLAAAVGDVRPAQTATRKLAKAELPAALPLALIGDIAAELGRQRQGHQKLIGFAAQTGDIRTPAREKCRRKGLDAIVANPVDLPGVGFGSDHNQAWFIRADGHETDLGRGSKLAIAQAILDRTLDL